MKNILYLARCLHIALCPDKDSETKHNKLYGGVI